MFTGLIERIGKIERIVPRGNYLEITVLPEPMFENMQKGESIAVSGPCLTVVSFDRKGFTVEASQETTRLTTLRYLKTGDRVNLERALQADSRLGGHFVSGHVDCAARVLGVKKVGESRQMEIELNDEFAGLIVDKGSVSLDGVSLTVTGVTRKSFAVNLIPETQTRTTLPEIKAGDLVNIEFDIIGKYILRFQETKKPQGRMTLETLRRMGY